MIWISRWWSGLFSHQSENCLLHQSLRHAEKVANKYLPTTGTCWQFPRHNDQTVLGHNPSDTNTCPFATGKKTSVCTTGKNSQINKVLFWFRKWIIDKRQLTSWVRTANEIVQVRSPRNKSWARCISLHLGHELLLVVAFISFWKLSLVSQREMLATTTVFFSFFSSLSCRRVCWLWQSTEVDLYPNRAFTHITSMCSLSCRRVCWLWQGTEVDLYPNRAVTHVTSTWREVSVWFFAIDNAWGQLWGRAIRPRGPVEILQKLPFQRGIRTPIRNLLEVRWGDENRHVDSDTNLPIWPTLLLLRRTERVVRKMQLWCPISFRVLLNSLVAHLPTRRAQQVGPEKTTWCRLSIQALCIASRGERDLLVSSSASHPPNLFRKSWDCGVVWKLCPLLWRGVLQIFEGEGIECRTIELAGQSNIQTRWRVSHCTPHSTQTTIICQQV